VIVDARNARRRAPLHDDAGTNVVWSGTFDWGDVDGALKAADRIVKIEELHFDRFSSTPLECSAALVGDLARASSRCTATIEPGVVTIWMAPAPACRSTSSASSPRTSAAASGTRSRRTYLTACCLLARKLKRPIQWTEWRTTSTRRTRTETIAGPTTSRSPSRTTAMLGFVEGAGRLRSLPALRAARLHHLGSGHAGLYRWRNIRVDFTQVVTNKSPEANRYSRMQQLWRPKGSVTSSPTSSGSTRSRCAGRTT
jgi:2-furoyl-CoA dehydrogenase large subunit